MKYYFTSDLHFCHENIIKYCKRPFRNIEHMHKELIKRWNARITPEDTVIHVGDFGFSKNAFAMKDRLNGNIIFIKGNHDRNNKIKTRIASLVFQIEGHLYNVVHDPAYANVNYEINITGHVHDKWEIKRIKKGYAFTDCINVGVDVWNFYPITYEEIMQRYRKWRKKYEKPKKRLKHKVKSIQKRR